MLRAIIFDFDGVIADSEPVHFVVFQHVLGEVGFSLSKDEYYAQYLGCDDRGCFSQFLTARGQSPSPALLDDLVRRKSVVYLTHIKQHLVIFPGVREFVRQAAAGRRLAICSGALRHEIEVILSAADIRMKFQHITSAEDVCAGKPDPEGFLHALHSLNDTVKETELDAAECLVIEDSIPGIRGARAAGMTVLAVANTHPEHELKEADLVVQSLLDVRLPDIERRFFS